MIKTVLASLTGYGSDRSVLDSAIAVARIGAGHVQGFHTRVDPIEVAALMGSVSPHRGDLQPLAQRVAERQAAQSQQAKAAFDEACKRHALALHDKPGEANVVSASWKETKNILDETFEEARYHDLTVMAREQAFSPERITSVLMHSGRPLLIAPPKPIGVLGRNIAIAWKAGPEAARAILAASSILARADHVSILSVSENSAGDDTDRESAERLAKNLAWHGIKTTIRMNYAPSESSSQALREMTYNDDVDLLVMGAYGHSRFHEFVFGGVTKDMVADCAIPVFLFR